MVTWQELRALDAVLREQPELSAGVSVRRDARHVTVIADGRLRVYDTTHARNHANDCPRNWKGTGCRGSGIG